MISHRRIAAIAGGLYLLTFATSIPALAIKTAYLDGAAGREAVAIGGVLELLLAASCVGTAVVLFRITRLVSPGLGIAFIVSRTLEASMILVGVLALLSVAMLRETGASELEPAFVALHDATFLIGPGVMSAVNALLLGTVMLRGRLVPRVVPIVGLVGAPLLLASSIGVLAGAWTQTSTVAAVAAIPIAAWELCLGLVLVIAGFRPAAITALGPGPDGTGPAPTLSLRR